MRELASELSKRYPDRIVMFDSPPLLAATQASALSHHVGQVVMVVEAGKTSQTTLQEAVELLSIFTWGHTFLELNQAILDNYAKALDSSEIIKIQNERNRNANALC